MLPWGFKGRDEPLPGARLVQDLLQRLLSGEFIEQVLILESSLEQSCPLGFRERSGGVPTE